MNSLKISPIILKSGKFSTFKNFKALLPIGVFLVLYLGLGILFEYVLKIRMGFYNIPIVVIFVIALLVACVQNPSVKFDEKLEIMGKGIGECMSTYKQNLISLIPYGKKASKYKAKKDGKGKVVVKVKKGKKKYTYKFDEEAGVIL